MTILEVQEQTVSFFWLAVGTVCPSSRETHTSRSSF
jgi:hypothetical protein